MAAVRKIIFTGILSVFMLIVGFRVCVKASYYEISVSAGFDNQAKYGRYVPAKVELYSEEDFEGMLSIRLMLKDGSEQVISYPVSLNAREHKAFRTWLPFFDKNNEITFLLKNQAGDEVKRRTVGVEMLEGDYTELFVGVLSYRREMVSLFDEINLGEYTDITFPYIFTRAFMINEGDIWGEVEYTLDCLDIIVLMSDMLSSLSDEQEELLINWAATGKTLIIEYSENEASDDENEVVNYENEAVGNEKPQISEQLRDIYMDVMRGQKEEDELRPGLWISSVDYGKGRIGFIISSDPEDRDFYMYTNNNLELVGMALGRAATLEVIDDIINYDMYYTNYDDPYEIQYMLNTTKGKEVPNMAEYVLVIAIYIILVGPVLYFILKSFGKVRFVLPCVMVISGIFSVLIYRMGDSSRFTDVFFQYASILKLDEEKVDETIYFSANVPYNDTYYLKFNPEYRVTPLVKITEDGADSEDYIELLYSDSDTKATLKKSVPFSREYFEAKREIKGNSDESGLWNVDVQVTYYDGVIGGMITNNSGKDLKNTALILYDKIVIIGSIKNGETKSLDSLKLSMLPYYQGDVADMILKNDVSENGGTDKKDTGKVSMAEYVIGKYFSEKNTAPLFMGFVDREEELQFGTEFEAYGNTLFYKEVDINTSIGSFSFEPLKYTDITNMDNNNNYDAYSNTTYSSRVRLQYCFDDIGSLVKIIFDCEADGDGTDELYYGVFSGEVEFYNNITLQYDKIDISGRYFYLSELANYLLLEGDSYTLTVHYEIETEGKYRYTEIKMPSVAAVRRLDYAESK